MTVERRRKIGRGREEKKRTKKQGIRSKKVKK